MSDFPNNQTMAYIAAALPDYSFRYFEEFDLFTGTNKGGYTIIIDYNLLPCEPIIRVDLVTSTFGNFMYATKSLHSPVLFKDINEGTAMIKCINNKSIQYAVSDGKIIDVTQASYVVINNLDKTVIYYNADFIAYATNYEKFLAAQKVISRVYNIENISIVNNKYIVNGICTNQGDKILLDDQEYYLMVQYPDCKAVLANLSNIVQVYNIDDYRMNVTADEVKTGVYKNDVISITSLEDCNMLYLFNYVHFAQSNTEPKFRPVNVVSFGLHTKAAAV